MLEGTLAISSLERLQDLLADASGEVTFRIEGLKGERGQSMLRLEASGLLSLACQRCLEAIHFELDIDSLQGGFTGLPVALKGSLGLENGDISINGNAGDDSITGGDGNTLLFGNAGNDTLIAGNGQTFMWGDAGADMYYGGAADDFFYLDDQGDRVVNAGGGYDRATLIRAGTVLVIDATWSGLERVDAAAGAEIVDAAGYLSDLFMVGNGGNDSLTGGQGNDSIFGNDGNDVLSGGADGDDVMLGGAGMDIFIFADGSRTDRINDWEDGLDTMDVSAITGVSGIGDLTILTGYLGVIDASDFDFTA